MSVKMIKVINVISLVLIALGAIGATFMAITGIGLNDGYTTAEAIPYAIGLDIGSIVYIVANIYYNR